MPLTWYFKIRATAPPLPFLRQILHTDSLQSHNYLFNSGKCNFWNMHSVPFEVVIFFLYYVVIEISTIISFINLLLAFVLTFCGPIWMFSAFPQFVDLLIGLMLPFYILWQIQIAVYVYAIIQGTNPTGAILS